jgi:hypothetical protein
VGDTQAIGVAYRDQDLLNSRIVTPEIVAPQFDLTPLSSATTPLTGSEVLAVVQGGVTKQLPITSVATAMYYGMFQDNNTQTNVGIGLIPPDGNATKLRTTDFANGISIVDQTKITLPRTGIYNMQFSAQFSRGGGGGGLSLVEIWLKKNGVNVIETNTQLSVASNNGKAVAAWNFLLNSTAGDYFELYWYSSDAAVEMWYGAAGTNPARPETPSIIVTVTQVT